MPSVQITRYLKNKILLRIDVNIKQPLRDTRNGISMSCQGKVATKIYQSINESLKGTTNFIKQSRMDHLTPLFSSLLYKKGRGIFWHYI